MQAGAIGSLLMQQNMISGSNSSVPVGTESFASILERAKKANETAPVAGTLGSTVQIDRTSKLYEQCQALESFLIKNLLDGMRKTIMKSDLMDAGFAGDMYEDMLYDQYATNMAKDSSFGMADLAYLELTGQRGKLLEHPLTGF